MTGLKFDKREWVPQSRPIPANVLVRLGKIAQPPAYAGLTWLAQANQSVVAQQAAAQARDFSDQVEQDRRTGLQHSAWEPFALISGEFHDAVVETASDGTLTPGNTGWIFQLGAGELHLSAVEPVNGMWRDRAELPFDVIAHASLTVKTTPPLRGYDGRKHSLWFCDAQQAGVYGWYEMAFMTHPATGIIESYAPFAMAPDATSRAALARSTAVHQVAWPFTQVEAGDLEEFITRWANWLVQAQARRLAYPASMPERQVEGSWRRGAA
ncbi:hypothetical protein [Catenulispora pinisilvae]|uniref:hypothetical protein n=1 Tax=Catenulispora pinisilvae TaxID=2705253 RepID=UPI001E547651|nr:hypothetical protein [Catenulispora pinisilvae]